MLLIDIMGITSLARSAPISMTSLKPSNSLSFQQNLLGGVVSSGTSCMKKNAVHRRETFSEQNRLRRLLSTRYVERIIFNS
jgi:hypothetical protein